MEKIIKMATWACAILVIVLLAVRVVNAHIEEQKCLLELKHEGYEKLRVIERKWARVLLKGEVEIRFEGTEARTQRKMTIWHKTSN